MNGTGLEYTTLILHRQREHELIEQARKNTLLNQAQEAARRIKAALHAETHE